MSKPKPKNTVELQKMRAAGRLAAEVLDMIVPHVKVGVSTEKLDDLAREFICDNGAVPAPLNYKGFPKSICTSINDVVCHGIPSPKEILKNGDILNIDVTVILDGFHGDTSRMYSAGEITPESARLIETTHKAMMAGIEAVESGAWLSEIGREIQEVANAENFGVVKDYCGHGLGKKFHEDPMVMHYFPQPNIPDMRLRKGTTFTIEPMINTGSWECETMADGWTSKTIDAGLSAQFEHSLAVTDDGFEIFTLSPAGLDIPPYKIKK